MKRVRTTKTPADETSLPKRQSLSRYLQAVDGAENRRCQRGVLEQILRHPLHIVIPTVDAELGHYITLRPALQRLGIATALPSAAALRAREKRRLPELGRRARVAIPDTTVLPSEEAVERVAPRLIYPQVLKGAMVDSKVVHWPEDFVVAARELAELWGYPLVTQPVIPGEEYDVAGVAREGELLGAAVMKKLGVTSKGTAWAGVTVDEPDLVEQTRRLARALMEAAQLLVLRDVHPELHDDHALGGERLLDDVAQQRIVNRPGIDRHGREFAGGRHR